MALHEKADCANKDPFGEILHSLSLIISSCRWDSTNNFKSNMNIWVQTEALKARLQIRDVTMPAKGNFIHEHMNTKYVILWQCMSRTLATAYAFGALVTKYISPEMRGYLSNIPWDVTPLHLPAVSSRGPRDFWTVTLHHCNLSNLHREDREKQTVAFISVQLGKISYDSKK